MIAGKIVRRQQARAVLAARDEARPARAARSQRITRLQAQAARAGARAAQEETACQARVADYQRRAAARSAAGSRKGPDGRVPVTAAESARVRAARAAERKARSGLAAAQAAQAAARAAPPGRASTTDPASRLMPAKKGGFDQLWNVQALAGGHQVILAIGTHDNPADTGALHPLLQRGRASLDAAGITAPIGAALFDAGDASDANFTAPCQPQLYIAVTREARQAAWPSRWPGPRQRSGQLAGDDRPAGHPPRQGPLQTPGSPHHRTRIRPAVQPPGPQPALPRHPGSDLRAPPMGRQPQLPQGHPPPGPPRPGRLTTTTPATSPATTAPPPSPAFTSTRPPADKRQPPQRRKAWRIMKTRLARRGWLVPGCGHQSPVAHSTCSRRLSLTGWLRNFGSGM